MNCKKKKANILVPEMKPKIQVFLGHVSRHITMFFCVCFVVLFVLFSFVLSVCLSVIIFHIKAFYDSN